MNANRPAWGLLRKRECLVPTWRGWLLLVLLAVASVWVLAIRIHPFLAVSAPLADGPVVVEGWLPDSALKCAVELVKQRGDSKLFVTGGPLESGARLSEYHSYAELGAAILVKLGLETNVIQAVPAPWVKQDRTYTSAMALKGWFQTHGVKCDRLTVVSEGPHGRRSRLLFAKAFGPKVRIGIISVSPDYYEPNRWWRSSQGVRVVVGEALAYAYARVVFTPGS